MRCAEHSVRVDIRSTDLHQDFADSAPHQFIVEFVRSIDAIKKATQA